MSLKINEVAKLTGITVRTLHYYDEIGLLAPSEITQAGYRIYNEDALATLQQILFFRELDFPLGEIKEIMKNPHYNQQQALAKHKELLMQKRSRLDGLITLVDKTIKGDKIMNFKAFDKTDFETNKLKYAAEVKARWGKTDAYQESEQKTSAYDDTRWKLLTAEGGELLKQFGENRSMMPDSQFVQDLVARWQSYITKHFYTCTKEILACLGEMYTSDERFTKNIDQYGEGTASFMASAITVYCTK